MSFIRGLVVNLAPLTAVANCDKARILKGHIDKRCIESQLLGKNLRYIVHLGFTATAGHSRLLVLTVGVRLLLTIVQAQIVLRIIHIVLYVYVSAVEGVSVPYTWYECSCRPKLHGLSQDSLKICELHAGQL